MTFKSGRRATATINGTEIAMTNWSIRPLVTVVEFRNSKTGRVPQREPTFVDISGSVGHDFDFDNNPFAVNNIVPGQKLANLKLYLDGTSGLFHSIPSALVQETPQDSSVVGKTNSSFSWVTNGAYQLAGGIDPAALLGS